MKKLLVLLALASGVIPHAYAQGTYPGQFPANTIFGNSQFSAAPAVPGVLTNNQMATTPAGSVKCNPGSATSVPGDCNFMCIIDGTTFPATIAGIQSAVNTTACKDIYIPAGTYNGTAVLTIARSNIKLHGAGGIVSPQGIGSGQTAATILSFSCFSTGNYAVVVGDSSATLTYGGVDLSDFEILLPSACNMTGLRIRPSTPDSGNMVRRVRVTELSGSTVGNGILLDQLVYSWRFEDVIVDHFLNGYNFTGQNHFTNIIGGQNRNNGIGFNHEVTLGSSNIVVSGVDIEGCVSYCFDIYTGSAWSIYGNYMDNGSSSGTRAIRIGGGGTVPTEGISIMNNYFNNGGTANYAIEIGTQGFYGLNIIANHFNNYATANVLNGASAGATAKKGVILGNDQFGSVPEMSSYQGMFTTDNSANVNTTVAGLPTCNVEMQGAHYFVTDLNNTGIGWKNAVTGSGSTGLNVTCNGSTWYQD